MNRKYFLSILISLLCGIFCAAQEPDSLSVAAAAGDAEDEHGVIDVVVKNSRVIDTLDTEDKFVKILLYEDYTWAFWDIGKPVIDTSGFYDGWDSEKIHAFKGLPLDSIPDEVDIRLVDDIHPFCVPVVGNVRSGFQFRRNRPHQGVDISLQTGDTVRTAFDGIVRYTGAGRETGGYGGLVIIRHNNGLETYYGHLSKRLVSVDEIVRAGEPIGLGGSTGRSTGPHLHFETRYYGKPFDPLRVVDFNAGRVRDSVLTLRKHYFSIYSHYGMSDKESKAATGRVYYTIKKGDTLSRIASRNHTTVSAICKLNKITTKTILRPGSRLRIR